MKRYHVGEYNLMTQRSSYEAEDGDWCKWEDVEALVVKTGTALIHEQDLKERIAELEEERDIFKRTLDKRDMELATERKYFFDQGLATAEQIVRMEIARMRAVYMGVAASCLETSLKEIQAERSKL